ncbi:hypothetical protein [Vibrio coralliilyticus]|uniref:hypothetical protein n=1 Tax=Vibrio coralliilyticus TaxID=190893 RepID=UPI0002EB48C4|nr:hypothetical protein [Vibrio coralliilyticus]
MARLFDVVREMSGHSASISIPRPYIKFCEGNHTHAAVLNQLVFWSSTKPSGEWFYKANDELAHELCLTVDQVRYAIRQLKKRLGDVIQSQVKKANSVPTTHYLIDGDRLVDLLFPDIEQNSQMGSVNLPDGSGNFTETKREDSQNQGSGNITDSINRSLPDTNEQIDPPKSPKGENIPYESIVDLYNEILGRRFTFCKALSTERKRKIKKLWGELNEKSLEAVRRYFEEFNRESGSFYEGKNDRGWKADFSYLMRSDVLVRTRERNLGGQVSQSVSEINKDTDWINDMGTMPADDTSWVEG